MIYDFYSKFIPFLEFVYFADNWFIDVILYFFNALKNSKQLLVIGKVWPEPKSSAAGSRMLQILSIFKENGYSVIFSSAAKRREYSFKLSKIGIQNEGRGALFI